MLVEFSVENYRSFKNEVTLSMVAAPGSDHPKTDQNTFTPGGINDFPLIKSAGIFGANASGKSNLIKAVGLMKKMVITSVDKKEKGFNVSPYRFEPECREKKPSKFEIVFIHEGVRYAYGFAVDREKVHHEYLYSYRSQKGKKIFERILNEDGKYKYSPGAANKKPWGDLQALTRPDSLFLTVANNYNVEEAKSIVSWFVNKIRIDGDLELYISSEFGIETVSAVELSDMKKKIMQLMKEADLHINDIYVRKETAAVKNFPEGPFTLPGLKKIDQDTVELSVVLCRHRTAKPGDEESDLSIYEESEGTRRYFDLLGPLIETFDKSCILLADELDVHLHPLMTRHIVEMFHNGNRNKNNAQLIFTTHADNLLDYELLRRDQIWFTQLDGEESTELYSLWDIKGRKDEAVRKAYLLGRYGAVPRVEQYLEQEQSCRESEQCRGRKGEAGPGKKRVKGKSAR